MKVESLKDLHNLGVSYWYACVLQTAVKLRVFTHLSKGEMDAKELAGIMETEPRATALLLNALAGLGLVRKSGVHYRNTSLTETYLDESSHGFMGNIIYHYSHMYDHWGKLDEAVRTGGAVVKREDRQPDATRQFLLGMHNLAIRGAEALVDELDFSPYESLLDLGGGPGTYALYFCRKHPQLSGVVFDLPDTEAVAREQIQRFGLAHRVTFQAGNFHTDRLPEGPFDVVFMSHILHSSSFDECSELIRTIYPIVKPGGEVIVQEFVLDDEKTAPTFAAVFALNMLIHTPHGRTFSYDEIKGWLLDAGFQEVKALCYDAPNDASLVMARK
jgi:ubiquinone/menaquinone biosynthesis C-methylase UbiE